MQPFGRRGPSEGDDQPDGDRDPDGHRDHDSADFPAGERDDHPGHRYHDPGVTLGPHDEPIRYPDADRHAEPGSGPQPHRADHFAPGLRYRKRHADGQGDPVGLSVCLAERQADGDGHVLGQVRQDGQSLAHPVGDAGHQPVAVGEPVTHGWRPERRDRRQHAGRGIVVSIR